MIVLLSQTKLPDSSNPLSDIVGAVQYVVIPLADSSFVNVQATQKHYQKTAHLNLILK